MHRLMRVVRWVVVSSLLLVVTSVGAAGPAYSAEPSAQWVIKIDGVWKANATYWEGSNLLCTQTFHATSAAESSAGIGLDTENGQQTLPMWVWDRGGDDKRTCIQIPSQYEGKGGYLYSRFKSQNGTTTNGAVYPYVRVAI